MMLSPEALKERMWGPFPTLRSALQNECIPDSYYGPSSVSDNMFEALQRAAKLAVLVREFAPIVRDAAVAAGGDAMRHDLERLAQFLKYQRSFFDEGIKVVERLSSEL